jgi:competence protein ComEC
LGRLAGAIPGIFNPAACFRAERERWALWLPVILGCGIGIYFALPLEPPVWIGAAALAGAAVAVFVLRKSPVALVISLMLVFFLLGFSVAQWRAVSVAAPILERSIGPVEIRGRVLSVEPRPRGERLVLDQLEIARLAAGQTPERVRITLAGGAAGLYPGDRVRGRAKLSPPPEPAAPGAYDFARAAYFQRLGAVGFAYGSFEKLTDGQSPGGENARGIGRLSRHWEVWWSGLRHRLSERIAVALPGTPGAIAAALMTGERGRVPEHILEVLRSSGLAHLLAISGLHIGLVTAGIFFAVRGVLALIPGLALNHPIKKWAALAALPCAFSYLMLVGATIPAQRAFLMTGLMLLAVLLDRRALSMRLVAWAAMVTLLLAPESLLSVSFQMSFAAVTLMIAAYEGRRGLFGQPGADFWSPGSIGRYLLAVAATSALATIATAPFAVYHFNHLALYGVFANVVAVPITAFWIMPSALAAFLLMPLGLEALPLWLMGIGIELVVATAESVASWPSAVVTLSAMPVWGLAAAATGGLWAAIWTGSWRLLGIFPMVASAVSLWLWVPPDLLVSADARLFALRREDGSLWRSSLTVNRFAADIWDRRAGVGASDEGADRTGSAPQCDSMGCIHHRNGVTVALAWTAGAVAEDCPLADLMISRVPVRIVCARPVAVIDRFDLWRNGAHAIWIAPGSPVEGRPVEGRPEEGGSEQSWSDAGRTEAEGTGGQGRKADVRAFRIESVAATRGNRPWTLRKGGE